MPRRIKIIAGLGFALLSLSMTISAQRVNADVATETATKWVINQNFTQTSTIHFQDSIVHDDITVAYRYRIDPTGFIWVSADYQAAPVLAYSFENNDPSLDPNHPAATFLQLYSNEIHQIKTTSAPISAHHPGWYSLNESRLKGLTNDDVVEPMLKVLWGQGSGYNQLTPPNTPTGCVAVAMVQIMRHWEWPRQPQGQHSYTHDVYGDFAIDLDTIQFDWADMPLTNPSIEVAQAMYYTGIALHMNYAPDGSGASTSRAGNLMKSSFRFHEKAREIGQSDFGAIHNWIRVIKNELINSRPILYRGQGTGGHAFNFDGFNGDYFHVNWGWSGSQNGYFLVTSLTPGSSNFSEAQGAIINLFPDTLLLWDRPYGMRILAGDAKVSLGWDGVYNRELKHYNIYRNQEFIGKTIERYYTDETPQNGVSYQYSVAAVYETDSADYESEKTSEITAQPAAGFVVPYQQDFESGYPGWQISSTPLGFRWGNATELGMGTDTSNYYVGINSGIAGNNKLVSDYMISNGLDFDEVSHVVLSFDYAFRKWQDVDQLKIMYRVFEDNVWIEFAEIPPTKGYHDWINYQIYLPKEALQKNVQLAFFYTDNGQVGYGAGIDNIEINQITEPGIPEFSVTNDLVCLSKEVIFTDLSQGTRNSYSWDFGEGADPRYADTEGPHQVIYKTSGTKSVKLILNGLDELTKENLLTVVRPASAKFSHSLNFKTVTFRNTSTNANGYFWDFGDGIRVMQENPVHTYAKSGEYLVKLVATNEVCGNDTTEQWISIRITGRDDIDLASQVIIYPNPVREKLQIFIPALANADPATIEVINTKGQLEITEILASGYENTFELDLRNIPAGIYFLRLRLQDEVIHFRFIRE